MARSSDEMSLLGDATPEELEIFAKEKKFDESVKIEVKNVMDDLAKKNANDVNEEVIRVKREGEKEIEEINKELSEFIKREEALKAEKEKEKNVEKLEETEKTAKKLNIFKKIKLKIAGKIKSISDDLKGKTIDEKIYIIKSMLIILLTLVTVTLVVLTFNNYRRNRAEGSYIEIELPKNKEYVSRVIVNKDLKLYKDVVSLGKITFDSENTVFYFDTAIDFKDKYRASLLDSSNRYYPMNYHFMENLPTSSLGRVVAFAPLPDGTRRFKLEIIDNYTSEEISFYFELDRNLYKQSTLKVFATSREEDEKVKFENVIAAESMTSINYSLLWPDEESYYYGIDDYGTGTATLTHNMNTVPLRTGEMVSYEFIKDNLLLLEGNYTPLSNYNGILKIVMSNIYKIYDINKEYNTRDILLKKAMIELKLDDYTLVIEGMDKRDDMAVLVYHVSNDLYGKSVDSTNNEQGGEVEDASKLQESIKKSKQIYYEQPYNEPRLLSLLDAEIIITNGEWEGDIIKVKQTYVGQQGGDLVFQDNRLEGLTSRDFEVRINKVKIKDAEYHAEINLDYIRESEHEDDYVEDAISDIKKAFDKRLSFKSGEITKSKITGFEKSILIRPDFNEYYSPHDLVSKAYYGSNIVSTAVTGNIVHAIVVEEWRGKKKDEFLFTSYEHEVVYDVEKQLIIYDKIR